MASEPIHRPSTVTIWPYRPTIALILPVSIGIVLLLGNMHLLNFPFNELLVVLGVINLMAYYYMHKSAPVGLSTKKRVNHLKFLLYIFGALLVAVLAGDTIGGWHFGAAAASSGGVTGIVWTAFILTIPFVGVLYVITWLKYLFTPANTSSLSIVTKVLIWLLVAIGCYIAYSFTYALRDPSTE